MKFVYIYCIAFIEWKDEIPSGSSPAGDAVTEAISDGAMTYGLASGSVSPFGTLLRRRRFWRQRLAFARRRRINAAGEERRRQSGVGILDDEGSLQVDRTGADELTQTGVCSGEGAHAESDEGGGSRGGGAAREGGGGGSGWRGVRGKGVGGEEMEF